MSATRNFFRNEKFVTAFRNLKSIYNYIAQVDELQFLIPVIKTKTIILNGHIFYLYQASEVKISNVERSRSAFLMDLRILQNSIFSLLMPK